MAPLRWIALAGVLSGVCGCGVRGNPKPPLPDVHPLPPLVDGGAADAGTATHAGPGVSAAAPDAGH